MKRLIKLAASTLVLWSAPALASTDQSTPGQTAFEAAAQRSILDGPEPEGPALWQVADENTTIYMIGTVHVLPPELNWFDAAVAKALSEADTIVTEIPMDPASGMKLAQYAQAQSALPEGTTLRSLLTDEQRATYDAALTSLGLQPQAFDAVEPWMASLSLVFVPLIQQGYDPESGTEKSLLSRVPDKKREAFETIEFQISMFDTLPQDKQIAMLMETVENIGSTKEALDAMVAEWLDGDADGLAALMNEGLQDAEVAETMLYSRNANWSDWIAKRLETTPGTVLVAVGAGHLAGERSVQDMLTSKGLTVTRVQ